jgi:hypothetical protein
VIEWPNGHGSGPKRAMRTRTTRRQYSRELLCYKADLADPEWAVIEPRLPPL